MVKFKAGDTVRCVDDSGCSYITKGRQYKVIVRGSRGDGYVMVRVDGGCCIGYSESRFERVNEMKKLKKGDWVVALLEEGGDVTKGRRYKVLRVYRWLCGEMRAEFRDDVGDSRSFGLEGNRFERISKMNETEELQAKISQSKIDQQKLKEEQERLEGELRAVREVEITYSIGDRFKQTKGLYHDTKHILAKFSGAVVMIGLDDGLAWRSCDQKVGVFHKITPAEFKQITGHNGSFVRYFDSQKDKEV